VLREHVFKVGRIAFEGTREELVEDPRIRKAYLGA
jgi:ABC-type branched-subunit amino acid transport system ATPase component